MIEPVQVVSICTSVALTAVVLELVRRRLLVEEYSFVWLILCAALIALSVKRDILHWMASWLGVHYPPAVLLLVLVFFAFVVSLGFSVVASRQRNQLTRLVEDSALMAAEIRELKERLDARS